MLKKYVWCGLAVLITGTAFALGTGGEENLRRKAKAGDAEAQYLQHHHCDWGAERPHKQPVLPP